MNVYLTCSKFVVKVRFLQTRIYIDTNKDMADYFASLKDNTLIYPASGNGLNFSASDGNKTSLLSDNRSAINSLEGTPKGYSLSHVILASSLVSVIMFVIVFGNLLVVIAIATDKNLKTTQNWFIASLAVADFLLGLIIMPFSLANEMMGYWYFGFLWCDLWKAIDVLLCTASILSICLISLDRYWSITRAVEYSSQRTPRRAATMIAAVWLLSAVICVPPLIGWKNPLPVSDYPLCLLSNDIGYVLYSTMGSFYIPCVIMVFVYFKIFQAARALARRNMKRKAGTNGAISETGKQIQSSPRFFEFCQDTTTIMEYTTAINLDRKVSVTLNVKGQSKLTNEESQLIAEDSDIGSFQTKLDSPSENRCHQATTKCSKQLVGAKDQDENINSQQVCPDVHGHDPEIEQIVHSNTVSSSPDQSTDANDNRRHNELKHVCSTEGKRVLMRKISGSFGKRRQRTSSSKGTKGWRTASVREHERLKRKVAKARERRATIVLGLIMAAFILCWFPFFTLYIITSFCYCIGEMVFAVVFWLGYCNSALNPIIYTVFNRDFRQAFHKIVCVHFRKCR